MLPLRRVSKSPSGKPRPYLTAASPPPPTPTVEEDELDAALNVLKDLDVPILSPSPGPQRKEDELVQNDVDISPLSLPQPQGKVLQCPIPGCQKKVVRLWNHVFQFHQKEHKYTGIFIYLLCVCVRILRLTSQRVKLCCDIRRVTKDNIYTYFWGRD